MASCPKCGDEYFDDSLNRCENQGCENFYGTCVSPSYSPSPSASPSPSPSMPPCEGGAVIDKEGYYNDGDGFSPITRNDIIFIILIVAFLTALAIPSCDNGLNTSYKGGMHGPNDGCGHPEH